MRNRPCGISSLPLKILHLRNQKKKVGGWLSDSFRTFSEGHEGVFQKLSPKVMNACSIISFSKASLPSKPVYLLPRSCYCEKGHPRASVRCHSHDLFQSAEESSSSHRDDDNNDNHSSHSQFSILNSAKVTSMNIHKHLCIKGLRIYLPKTTEPAIKKRKTPV